MSVCLTLASSSATAMDEGGDRACAGTLLLQTKAKRSKHVSSPASPHCPRTGKQCTIIVILKDGANGTKIVEPYNDKAVVTVLKAVGDVLLDFGKDQGSECCHAYKNLLGMSGVKAVEFDKLVYAIDGVEVGKIKDKAEETVEDTVEPGETPSPKEPSCPADGEQCTVIVILKDGAHGSMTGIGKPYEKSASVSYLKAVGGVILDFGRHETTECCAAYRKLLGRTGVTSVEFDSPVYAVDKPHSKARLTCLWPLLPWIIAWVLTLLL